MRTLLGFEFYKIITQKWVYMFAFILLGLNIFFMYQMTGPSIQILYSDWEGPVTEDKLKRAKAELEALYTVEEQGKDLTWEENKQKYVYNQIENAESYMQYKTTMIASLEEKLNHYSQDTYVYRKAMLEKEMLAKVDYDSVYYQLPAEQIVDYVSTFGLVFLGTLIIIGLSPLFSQEVTTGVDQMIYSTKHGRRTIIHAKVTAALLFVGIAQVVSISFGCLFWILVYGNHGWQTAIQATHGLYESPYPYDLLTFFLIKVGYQTLAAFAFALFVLLISALLNNSLITFAISGGVFIFPLAVESILSINEMPLLREILKFTYTELMLVDVLFKKLETVNLFGYPILYPFVGLVVLAIAITGALYVLSGVLIRDYSPKGSISVK